MNSIQKFIARISLYRWELAAVAGVVGIMVLVWFLLLPHGQMQWRQWNRIIKQIQFIRSAELLPVRVDALERENGAIDSTLHLLENRTAFNESLVLEKLYALADSVKCTIEKVQVSDPLPVTSGMEIPVYIQGKGAYDAVGCFVSGIENGEYTVRIRQLSAKKDTHETISIIIDFVIMESKL